MNESSRKVTKNALVHEIGMKRRNEKTPNCVNDEIWRVNGALRMRRSNDVSDDDV